MRSSFALSVAIHGALLGGAWYLLGTAEEAPDRPGIGLMVHREAAPEPEPELQPPEVELLAPDEPLDDRAEAEPTLDAVDADTAPDPEFAPEWEVPDRAALTRVVRIRARSEPPTTPQPEKTVSKAKATPAPAPRAKVPPTSARPVKGACAPVRYPPRARRRGQEGTVLLRVHVDSSGAPGTIQVLRSSGHRSLDASARAAVGRWRFQPATRDGKRCAQWIRVPIRFELKSRS